MEAPQDMSNSSQIFDQSSGLKSFRVTSPFEKTSIAEQVAGLKRLLDLPLFIKATCFDKYSTVVLQLLANSFFWDELKLRK